MNGNMQSNGAGRTLLRWSPWGAAAILLLAPALAMRFAPGSGVDWDGKDFALMGALLATACGLYELGTRLGRGIAYRAGFGVAVLAGLLTVWVNLAVGMLGGEGDAANLMFVGVLVVAAVGALLARMAPAGMAWAMRAAALAQLAAVAVGMAIGGFRANELVLTAMFALPWLLAGELFAKSARDALRAPMRG